MSNAQVPKWLDHVKLGAVDDRPAAFNADTLLYRPKGEVSG
jgi:hypothetical protein